MLNYHKQKALYNFINIHSLLIQIIIYTSIRGNIIIMEDLKKLTLRVFNNSPQTPP